MADHWVAEMFPPKFSFQTIDDLQEQGNTKLFPASKGIDKAELYSRVIKELENEEKSRVEEPILGATEDANAEKSFQDSEEKYKQTLTHSPRNADDSLAGEEIEEDCIWSNKELRTLRKFVQKIKLQNLHLAGMLESVQKQLKESKEKETNEVVSLNSLKEKWSELKKRYQRVKISCKAMKKDVKGYHGKLKIVHQDLKEMKSERSEILTELNETKSKLNLEMLKKEELEEVLARKENEKLEALRHQGFVLKEQHALEKLKLIREISVLKEQLHKEQNDNSLNKKALEQLRTHFASMQLNSGKDSESIGANILSIVDIDYLPN